MAVFLAVDRGGSGSRFRLIRDGSPHLERSISHTTFHTDPIAPLIAYARELEVEFGPIDRIALGVSGLFGRAPAHWSREWTAAAGRSALPRIIIADDAVTAYLGALGNHAGVVCAVGTGTVTLASDGEGRTGRADGWGLIGGDLGSAHWIGEAAARTALGDIDGRRPAPAIREAFLQRYAHPHAFAATTSLQLAPKSYVADFARDVLGLAESGDGIATEIVDRAATHLADAIVAASDQVGLVSPSIALTGRLVTAKSLLAARVRYRVEGSGVRPSWVVASGTPLDGATLLATGGASATAWKEQVVEFDPRVTL